MESTEIIIQSAPTQVEYICPHCEEEIEIDYNEFESDMTSECWCDWEYQTIKCPNCKMKIKISSVEYD